MTFNCWSLFMEGSSGQIQTTIKNCKTDFSKEKKKKSKFFKENILKNRCYTIPFHVTLPI